MRRKQNSLRSRGSGISISMRSNTVCVAQTDSAEAACVSRLPMTIGTRDLSVEWRNILKVYECLQLADFVAKVGGPLQVRNFRIQRARRLNQCCAAGLFFESMLRVGMRKIFLQQYRSKADITARQSDVRITPTYGHLSAACEGRLLVARLRVRALVPYCGPRPVPAACALAVHLMAGIGDDHSVFQFDEAAARMQQRGLDRDHLAGFERKVGIGRRIGHRAAVGEPGRLVTDEPHAVAEEFEMIVVLRF